ncbi:MAG: hypothetical protein IPF47_12830 [Gemmatimonadetes bacterium]|nr:hypothetical protein [Gemmatimonadota bacterium]MBK7832704.1 hypothetical protein [Gemmatimonadota bacterium]
MTSFRPAALAVVALLLAACSADAPTAIPAVDAPLLAKTPTPVPSPDLSGHWVENPKLHYILPDGRAQEVWYEFDVRQSGLTLSGSVRRYVSYFDVNGAPTVVRFDLGSPGKVSGSIAGSTVHLGFLRVNESKQNLGYVTTLGADLKSLTVVNPTQYGAVGFTR